MPIASMGDEYPEAHWVRVRRILQRGIERAGMRAQLVWENPEVDVIQTAILQNLYENDVGLRLVHSQKAMAVARATPERKLAASLS